MIRSTHERGFNLRRVRLIFSVLSTAFCFVAGAAEPLLYVVKAGDTSSTIAQKFLGKPVFTKDGSLSKLLAWNPKVRNADLIFVGQVLRIETPASPSRELTSGTEALAPSQASELPAQVEHFSAPKKHAELWMWLGGGMNFQYYKQSIPGVDGEVLFQNIQGPTLFFRAGSQGDVLGLDLSYKETPGKMSSSSSITVTSGNYNWRTVSVEGLYRKDDQWNFRAGFQHHSMPFTVLDAVTATLDVQNNTLTMLSLGFDRSYRLSERLRGEWQMRYQHPLISGSSNGTPFSVTSEFAFDGTLGTVYLLNREARLGLFWYGQWHQYGFRYGRDTSRFSGSQTLFYSNIEMRLGYEF